MHAQAAASVRSGASFKASGHAVLAAVQIKQQGQGARHMTVNETPFGKELAKPSSTDVLIFRCECAHHDHQKVTASSHTRAAPRYCNQQQAAPVMSASFQPAPCTQRWGDMGAVRGPRKPGLLVT